MSSLTEAELIDMGLVSLAETFGLPAERIRRDLVASRAINWGNDPFARGAYSYAENSEALAVLRCSRSRPRFWTAHDKPFRRLDPCPCHT